MNEAREEWRSEWDQGVVLVEGGCLIWAEDEDGERKRCGAEPVVGVWVDPDDEHYPVLDAARPVVFCAKHMDYPARFEVRGLGTVMDLRERKVASVLDGPPSAGRIHPIPDP